MRGIGGRTERGGTFAGLLVALCVLVFENLVVSFFLLLWGVLFPGESCDKGVREGEEVYCGVFVCPKECSVEYDYPPQSPGFYSLPVRTI